MHDFLKTWVVVFVFWSFAAFGKPVGSVQVLVAGIQGGEEIGRFDKLAVHVSIGTKLVYRSRWATLPTATWNASVRIFSAAGNPICFEVVGLRAIPGSSADEVRVRDSPTKESTHEREQGTLEFGFDELVDDFTGKPPKDEQKKAQRSPSSASAGKAGPVFTVCKAKIAWPPKDGAHRLKCGDAILIVKTRWLGDKP